MKDKEAIVKNFQYIGCETPLWDDSFPISFDEYNKLAFAEGVTDLLELLDIDDDDFINKLKMSDILTLPFERAHEIIDRFSLAKRIELLEDLQERRMLLYSQAGKYGAEGLSRDEQLTAAEWKKVIGRIKHLEIIQAWLYGI